MTDTNVNMQQPYYISITHKVLFIADEDEKYNLTALNSISISVIQPEVNIGKLERVDVYI